jgi:hypothetical protein
VAGGGVTGDAETIRAALRHTSWPAVGSSSAHADWCEGCKGDMVLDRLLARLEAAERELEIVERVSQRNANAHMDAERRAREAVARLEAAEEALLDLISSCAPPVEALCAVHADGKYIGDVCADKPSAYAGEAK